jgi:hypothetical protein
MASDIAELSRKDRRHRLTHFLHFDYNSRLSLEKFLSTTLQLIGKVDIFFSSARKLYS